MRNNAGKEGAAVAVGKYARWLEPDGLLLLTAWARDGLNDEQIAQKCGVNVRTLYDWKKVHSPISQALKKGKEVVDIEVENALLRRALGYDYEETVVEEADGFVKRRTVRKHMPPDTTAQIYWLKNRKPDVWRDRAQAENKDALERLDRLIGEIDHAAQS